MHSKTQTIQFILGAALLAALLSPSCASTRRNAQEFGAPITGHKAIFADELLANPDPYLNHPVVVVGSPVAVCQKKGCWMMFTNKTSKMRVTFKDYAFFVPLDSAGRKMRFEGTPKMITISEAEARDYLEDEGREEEAKKIVGPQHELGFVATGVVLESPQ